MRKEANKVWLFAKVLWRGLHKKARPALVVENNAWVGMCYRQLLQWTVVEKGTIPSGRETGLFGVVCLVQSLGVVPW